MEKTPDFIQRKIYTVSELNAEVKTLLEDNFPFIWISGEISNFHRPASGHFYFTLKDESSQINSVMFRGQSRNLKFDLEDGLNVIGMGRISVYEPRGTYQIIFEYLEPKGIGALQLAFEQLKARLASESLFDENHKKPLPFLPQKISLITSPTGAVVHDILNIANRRFPNLSIEIIPVKVQGEGAEAEIVSAIELLNFRGLADVAILARGGGSLEDLHAFNSEVVARAVFSSTIPIVSAVGHETDVTIADFVADLRAPTPSAAAELVIPSKEDLRFGIEKLSAELTNALKKYIERCRSLLTEKSFRLVDPRRKISDLRLRTDDYTDRIVRLVLNTVQQMRERLVWRTERLFTNSPQNYIDRLNQGLDKNTDKLLNLLDSYLVDKQFMLRVTTAKLAALSPTAILDRGYSITRTIPAGALVRDSRAVQIGQDLEVLVAKGALRCRVKGKFENGPKNV